ncbi:hypothetical protein TRVL_08497 [Trypanosoma vivax]|nr:hypothetical protein TRVL_08497 [Trypanosoma vivax]
MSEYSSSESSCRQTAQTFRPRSLGGVTTVQCHSVSNRSLHEYPRPSAAGVVRQVASEIFIECCGSGSLSLHLAFVRCRTATFVWLPITQIYARSPTKHAAASTTPTPYRNNW